ncbi:MAG: thioredoxin domain-containing protein [Anaerolineae bacterium]|nr:thioredoxin domain-containing protein [Anaerolineae bacterium]
MKVVVWLVAVLMLVGVSSASAHPTSPKNAPQPAQAEAERWRWAEVGLSFDYPADWSFTRDQQFDFILVSPESSRFIGLQSGPLPEDSSLEDLMARFGEQFGSTPEAIEFGGVDAFQLVVPPSNDAQGLVIGYEYREGQVALLNFQAMAEDWEAAFGDTAQEIIASAEVDPLDLDLESINAQLQASLEADEPMVIGDPDARVLMVEVLDFSCVHCVRFANSLDRILQDYVASGQVQVRLVHITSIGGEASEVATHAQLCAIEQGLGWQMHELLVKGYQAVGGREFYTLENILAAVQDDDLELATEDFQTCIEEKRHANIIEIDTAYANEFGIRSTPSLLFGVDGETPQFLSNPDGTPAAGGLPLITIYAFFDEQLAEEAGG